MHQIRLYLNQVIEAMRPYFSSPYALYDHCYQIPTHYTPSFPSLPPFVYVYYNSPLLQSNFPQNQMQVESQVPNGLQERASPSSNKSSPEDTHSYSQKSLGQEVTKRQQKRSQDSVDLNLKKKAQEPIKSSMSKEDSQSKLEENRFVKKNTQSNIVSQIFSFLWSPQKNHEYLPRVLSSSEKVRVFHGVMRAVKLKCKSQINRSFLKNLMRVQEWPACFKKVLGKVRGHEELDVEEFASSLRRLCWLYLRDLNRSSIMTSKKMNKKLWNTHFKKCQQIKGFLFRNQEER